MKWDLVDSIDDQRKKFNSCLDKILSLEYLSYAKKAQKCVKEMLKENKKLDWDGWCREKNVWITSNLKPDDQDYILKHVKLEFNDKATENEKWEQ